MTMRVSGSLKGRPSGPTYIAPVGWPVHTLARVAVPPLRLLGTTLLPLDTPQRMKPVPSSAPMGCPTCTTSFLKRLNPMNCCPPSDSAMPRLRAHCNPTSHPYSAAWSGRKLSDASQPRLRSRAAFAAWNEKPVEGETGAMRITSAEILLYQVTLASPRSLKNPRSRPVSNSWDRSGFRVVAALVVLAVRPPRPLYVGVKPVPCDWPARGRLEKVCDVRYGSGS